jgi:hypothetical protein
MMANRIKLLYLIPIVIFLLIPCIIFADITYKVLDPIKNGLSSPEDVAVSPDGKIYVVDGDQNKIFIYDRRGVPAGSIQGIMYPSSVAINTDGTIYIGSKNDLSVKILNPSLSVIGSLGQGAWEFKLPMNIAVDRETGNVYVADQLDHSIKIYTSEGVYLRKITDAPNLPQDVTIMNREIYVIDHPLITDYYGGTMRGARVQVFDMDGNVIAGRSFGSYGSNASIGQFRTPAGIVSDSGGKLYITDSFHNVVMCFKGADGTYLGQIKDPTLPMNLPSGIALGEDRRLFIASLNTSSVYIFGLEGYTSMDVSPSSLSYEAQEGGPNPSHQDITISNTGTGTLTYEVTSTGNWIEISGTSGTVEPGGSVILSIGVKISGLSAGTYNGEITITDNSGISEVVTVTLEIMAPPEPPLLTVNPQALDFTYKIGNTVPSSRTVTIELSNVSGPVTWTATPDSGWIRIDPSTGSGNSDLITVANVEVAPANLTPGPPYTGNITIDAPGTTGSPVNIKVNLTVEYAGTINVSCNISEASFTIAGPGNISYTGSGTNWTATEVPDGTYTITYNPVVGYKTPPSETKTITNGDDITFEGNYISLAMSANIVVSRGADSKKSPALGIFDANGTMLFSFVPFSRSKGKVHKDRYQYGVNTAIGDIDGDGKADIVAALGAAHGNPAAVEAYRADGSLIQGSDFIAMNTMNTMYGANIAVADFDGDGKAEIVVSAGPSTKNPARVRIFKYENGDIKDTGIDFTASKSKGSVNIAAGDIDGDGIPELITAAGAKNTNSPEVRVWKIDTSSLLWSIVNTGIKFIAFSGKYGANVTTGDLNGDGISEIIVSSGPDPDGGLNIIKAFNGDGTEFGLTITDSSVGYGLNVASADLDNDGVAEIVAGLGPSSKNPSTVKVYKADGTRVNIFNAFNDGRYGAIVSAGELGY